MNKEDIPIQVSFSEEQIKTFLLDKIRGESSHLLADVIINCLKQTPKGLPFLTKAILGIKPACKYSVGQMVWIDFTSLPSWRINKEKSKALPSFKVNTNSISGGSYLCQILKVNPYSSSEYLVKYTAFVDDVVIDSQTYDIHESCIIEPEENPLARLEELEKWKEDTDLPL